MSPPGPGALFALIVTCSSEAVGPVGAAGVLVVCVVMEVVVVVSAASVVVV